MSNQHFAKTDIKIPKTTTKNIEDMVNLYKNLIITEYGKKFQTLYNNKIGMEDYLTMLITAFFIITFVLIVIHINIKLVLLLCGIFLLSIIIIGLIFIRLRHNLNKLVNEITTKYPLDHFYNKEILLKNIIIDDKNDTLYGMFFEYYKLLDLLENLNGKSKYDISSSSHDKFILTEYVFGNYFDEYKIPCNNRNEFESISQHDFTYIDEIYHNWEIRNIVNNMTKSVKY